MFSFPLGANSLPTVAVAIDVADEVKIGNGLVQACSNNKAVISTGVFMREAGL